MSLVRYAHKLVGGVLVYSQVPTSMVSELFLLLGGEVCPDCDEDNEKKAPEFVDFVGSTNSERHS